MSQLQRPRGTRDLLPQTTRVFRHVERVAADFAERFGFAEIETPILEPLALFDRGLGETSDIVSKQMYSFTDRGGDMLVLRPEGTAGVARAFINEGLAQQVPLRLFYKGPMFRYERPQKGRYRQFTQFGAELLGSESPAADLEVLSMAWLLLTELGLGSRVRLLINTIGDETSRMTYRDELVKHLQERRHLLSDDSKVRLEKNPLRILDSKDEGDRKAISDAPRLSDSLSPSARAFFDQILAGLDLLQIPYQIDERLVRGLDYYCHTVFEFVTDELGAQNAVLSGGRYDGLIKDLGGPLTPGVGWAFGTDRMAELFTGAVPERMPIAIVPLGEAAERHALKLAQEIRQAGFRADLALSGNLSKRMKRADKVGASHAIIFGNEELARGCYQMKNLRSSNAGSESAPQSSQVEVPHSSLLAELIRLR
jgi:histidyl-tRNA synthetase